MPDRGTLKIPHKHFVNTPADIGSVIRQYPRQPEKVTRKLVDDQMEEHRQNWLELERWAQNFRIEVAWTDPIRIEGDDFSVVAFGTHSPGDGSRSEVHFWMRDYSYAASDLYPQMEIYHRTYDGPVWGIEHIETAGVWDDPRLFTGASGTGTGHQVGVTGSNHGMYSGTGATGGQGRDQFTGSRVFHPSVSWNIGTASGGSTDLVSGTYLNPAEQRWRVETSDYPRYPFFVGDDPTRSFFTGPEVIAIMCPNTPTEPNNTPTYGAIANATAGDVQVKLNQILQHLRWMGLVQA